MAKAKKKPAKRGKAYPTASDEENSVVGEPLYTYSSASVAGKRWKVDFDLAAVSHFSSAQKISLIKAGISKRKLEEMKIDTGIDYDSLSELLGVSRNTLINKKGEERFDQNVSERILLFADLLSYGYEVFEDRNLFHQWLRKSNKALGGQAPLIFSDTLYGLAEVKKELGRIEHGVW